MPVVLQDVTETVSRAVQIQLVQLPVPQPVVMVVQITVEVPAVPSKTEELLAELTLKLGTESIANEIKKAVREELDKEMLARPALAAVAPAASEPAPAEPVVVGAPAVSEHLDNSGEYGQGNL